MILPSIYDLILERSLAKAMPSPHLPLYDPASSPFIPSNRPFVIHFRSLENACLDPLEYLAVLRRLPDLPSQALSAFP